MQKRTLGRGYGPFTNEILVGDALAPVREKVSIATKFGWDIDEATGARRTSSSRSATFARWRTPRRGSR